MPNLTNKEVWIEPSNIPKQFRAFYLDDENFLNLLSTLENSETLSQMESAINWAYESQLFLKEL